MRIARHEIDAAKPLKFGMGKGRFHRGLGEAVGPVLFQNVNIADIREGGEVGDYPHQAHLGAIGRIDSDAE